MQASSLFERPLLIYDDKCSSCGKFAKAASSLSRGWIRTAGHYHSEEARMAKKIVFPEGYDSTKMFWIINRNGAYGARKGLLPLAIEIIRGALFKQEKIDPDTCAIACGYTQTMICNTKVNTIKRLVNLLRNSGYFPFN